MNRVGRGIIGVALGLLLSGEIARAESAPTLSGKGHLAINLESELASRDMRVEGAKERERVARQSIQLNYGPMDNLDLFAKFGLGKITFEKADLGSRTRPLSGIGFRSAVPFWGGYFAGLSAQYQFGTVSKFDRGGSTLTTKDQWTETDTSLFVGTKDLIRDPEPDLRFYTGVRFSSRNDKLTPENQPARKVKQDSSIGGIIGMDFSDRNIFRFTAELGTGDRNNILIRFGFVF